MVARDLAVRVLTMTGGLALAIMLGPGAFGVWAVGLGIVAALQAATRSGLGATLLRRVEAPSVTLAAVGWMVLGPLWVALWGLVQARGDVRGPLVGGAVQLVVLWTTAIVLAPSFGARAIGAAFLGALLLTAALLYVNSRSFVRLRLATLAHATAIGAVAAAAGRIVADQMPTLTGLPLAAAAAIAVWSLLAIAFMPRDLQTLAHEVGLSRMLWWRASGRS